MSSPEKRSAKKITKKEEVDFILSLNEDTITESVVFDMFGDFDGEPKYNPYDLIEIPAKTYGIPGHMNIEKFTTTVGLWVYNRYFIERSFTKIFGYINETIGKKVLKRINETLSYALLEDKITVEEMKRFIDKSQKFSVYVSVISPNTTMKMALCSKAMAKKREELYRTKYKEGIDNCDPVVAEALTNELLDYAREYLKDDPSMDSFDSGALGTFDNNFKNMYITKGAIKDPDPLKGYNMIMSSYMDGIQKDEYSTLAKSLTAGPYARAKKTEIGGYWEKLFLPAYGHIQLDKPGSDCGTDKTVKIAVTNDNIASIMYCYVKEGSKLTEITSDNRDKFIGKTINIRFSSMCKNPKICNKCAGNMYYRLGITNIGTAVPQIASILKNICMKGFHDSTVRTSEMDPMKAFSID
jgi:hypothetical protein